MWMSYCECGRCTTSWRPGHVTCRRCRGLTVARSSLRGPHPSCHDERGLNLVRCLRRILVLPDPDYGPAKSCQVSVRLPVTLLIPTQLLRPPQLVRTRSGSVLRAHVPEATVDEDHNFDPSEDDVRAPSRKPGERALYAEPATACVEDLPNRQLWTSVPPTLATHPHAGLSGRPGPVLEHARYCRTGPARTWGARGSWPATLTRVERSGPRSVVP